MNKNRSIESGTPEESRDHATTPEEFNKVLQLDSNEAAESLGDDEENWLMLIERPDFEELMKQWGFDAKIERDKSGYYKEIKISDQNGNPLFFSTNKKFDATSRHFETGKGSVN